MPVSGIYLLSIFVYHNILTVTISHLITEYELIRSAYLSDTSGSIQILETQYNDILRGMILDEANYGNKFPNEAGV